VIDRYVQYRFAFGEAFDSDPAFCLHRCVINITLRAVARGGGVLEREGGGYSCAIEAFGKMLTSSFPNFEEFL
jgi:hypothetical protein